MKKLFVLFLMSVFIFPSSFAQDRAAEKWRDKNWKPKKGKYFFNKVYTWEYRSDLAEFEEERNGEFSIYVDEKSGTFLLTPESYIFSGPMTDFIIADQKGTYIVAYTEEFGEKTYEVFTPEAFKLAKADMDSTNSRFKDWMKPIHKTADFGGNDYGWPVFKGEEYALVFPEMPEDSTFFHLGQGKYSFLPIYIVNDLETEAKLPYPYNYSPFIPENLMVLREFREYQGWTNQIQLKSLSDTEYYIDLKAYTKIKSILYDE